MKTSCLYSAESYKRVDLWPHEGEQNRITMKKKLQTTLFSRPEKALSWCQNAVALTDLLHGEAYRMKGWMCETKRLRGMSKQSKPNHKREYLIVFISKSKKTMSGTIWSTKDHQPHVFQIDRFTYMSSLCSRIHILEFRAKDFFLTDGADM